MGTHRKNHKQKLAAFKQRKKDSENRTKKMQKMFMDNYIQQQENARKEFMLETIYMNRNELVKEVEGVWTLNTDVIETQNDMLVWKADGNPILAGLETSIDAYAEYTEEFVNQLLPQIQSRLKWKAEKEAADLASEANIQILDDPNFIDALNEAEIIETIEKTE